MKNPKYNFTRETRFAKSLYGDLPKPVILALKKLIQKHQISVENGDVRYLGGGWYVTHSGLLGLAEHRHCAGIHSRPVLESSDPANSRWVFRAAVFKSRTCKGFVGYGDADPSNVSPLVHGAEMRVAETRAVNRALRKAYGIGICSVEEIGSFDGSVPSSRESKKLLHRGCHRPTFRFCNVESDGHEVHFVAANSGRLLEGSPKVNSPVGGCPLRVHRCLLGSEAQDIVRAVVQLAYSGTGVHVWRSPPIVT